MTISNFPNDFAQTGNKRNRPVASSQMDESFNFFLWEQELQWLLSCRTLNARLFVINEKNFVFQAEVF